MTEKPYRAVFLRVHPTGKMVLSLTTESDGNETRYAELVAHGLGVPPLDVKVVPDDTDRFDRVARCFRYVVRDRFPKRDHDDLSLPLPDEVREPPLL